MTSLMSSHQTLDQLSLICLARNGLLFASHISGFARDARHGSVRGEERFIAVQNFNKNEDTFVFLLSTKAGK
jgi:hypothetical protein